MPITCPLCHGAGRLLTVVEQARAEVETEFYREAVEAEKVRLRQPGATWWHSLFPWTVTITRRD